MPEERRFTRGDRVRHPGKPEWGAGRIESAHDQTSDGKLAQRLVVTFDNHGRVTLNTAFATLAPADELAARADAGSGWLSQLEKQQTGATAGDLTALPEDACDPFRPLAARVKSTLELYRYDNGPRGLIDWAVAQTGLNDPLAEHSRHDLELAFDRFVRARDQHLRELLLTIRQKGERATLDRLAAELPAPLKAALDRARSRL